MSTCGAEPSTRGDDEGVMSRNRAESVSKSKQAAISEPEWLSGWSPAASERKDFYHRVRAFPAAVRRWRQALVKQVLSEPVRFPLAAGLSNEDVRPMVDDGITFLREIARILTVLHGTPRLGNKDDPVDELVYIILARKTREGAYQDAFSRLKRAFPSWERLLSSRCRFRRNDPASADRWRHISSATRTGNCSVRNVFSAEWTPLR